MVSFNGAVKVPTHRPAPPRPLQPHVSHMSMAAEKTYLNCLLETLRPCTKIRLPCELPCSRICKLRLSRSESLHPAYICRQNLGSLWSESFNNSFSPLFKFKLLSRVERV